MRYFFRSGHRKGFGVHSPFVFYLVTKVIEERCPYYKYELVEKVRDALLKTKKSLMVEDGEQGGMELRSISKEVAGSMKLPSYDQLLFRLVNHSKAQYLLEMKSSFGLSTMYMAAPDSRSRIWTMEEGETAVYANLSFGHAGFRNIHLTEGRCGDKLDDVLRKMDRIDFLFFNPDDRVYDFSQMERMFLKCSSKLHSRSVVVLDAIHRSEASAKLWRVLKSDERVRVTVDVYSYGIAYYGEELQKEDYDLRFFPAVKDWVYKTI